jgi:hypothetical protein
MDKIFMEEYFNLKYADTFLTHALGKNEHCKNLYTQMMELMGRAESAMRNMGDEYLMLNRELFVSNSEFQECLVQLAYLQGAEDREKMLR